MATQPDGKIVLVGSEDPGSLIVVRLLADGAFDPSFGSGGKVTTPFPGAGNFGEGRAVAIQPDGKIVVAGAAKGAVESDFLDRPLQRRRLARRQLRRRRRDRNRPGRP